MLKNRSGAFVLLFLYTAAVMLFCCGMSPLVNHMGTDGSVYFTIGRAMAAGRVPYRDLFDHKGLYIYLFHELGARLGGHGTAGLWCIALLLMFINVLLLRGIARLFVEDEHVSLLFVLLSLAAFLYYFSYEDGDSVEVFCLTLQLLSIWLLVRYLRTRDFGEAYPPREMFVHGVCVGAAAGMRANLACMWIPVALLIGAVLIFYRRYRNLLWNLLAGAGGVFVGVLPVFLYGCLHGCLREMCQQMIIFNLSYAGGNSAWLKSMLSLVTNVVGLPVIAGCLVSVYLVMTVGEGELSARLLYLSMLAASFFSVSMSGRAYGHYYEYLMPMLLPALLWLAVQLRPYAGRLRAAVLILFILTLAGNLHSFVGTILHPDYLAHEESAAACAKLVKELSYDNARVLVTNNHALYYNKMQVIPEEKYFYVPNIPYEDFPEALDAQANSILSGRNDVIVVCYADFHKRKVLNYGIRNDEIRTALRTQYRRLYSDERSGVELYARKDLQTTCHRQLALHTKA